MSVSAIGLGCMSLSGVYGAADDAVSEDLIRYAIDQGVDHFDSSDMYGWGHNEEVLGRALKGRRDRVVLATKFGQTQRPGQSNGVNGRPEYVIEACDASLKRLGVDVIDLYYQHRVDPDVPVEDTVGAMAQAGAAGQGPVPRPVGGAPGPHPPRPRRASDRGRADRIFVAVPRRGGRNAAHHARAWHQLRRLCAAGPRLPDRRDPEASTTSMAAAPRIHASRRRTSTRTAPWWRRSRRSRSRKAARRRR